ncbi:hypothetical protein ISR92_00885 [Patescibacteria group bacterium]|nr:hypothetical protein [Patescibacteria group bacterium]
MELLFNENHIIVYGLFVLVVVFIFASHKSRKSGNTYYHGEYDENNEETLDN